MYFIIYETTNLLNGMKYRGLHKCKSLDDGYLGSGRKFRAALNKYGKENFSRKILEFCKDANHLSERERYWVDEVWVRRKDTYNLALGGGAYTGDFSVERKKRISEATRNAMASKEIRDKISNTKTGKKISPRSEEHKAAIRKSLLRGDVKKKLSDASKKGVKARTSEHYKKAVRSKKFNAHIRNALEWEKKMGWTK